ncbi:Hypothetical predicted protein [Lecanosticta acicola]|uniref:Uncharacterized protein n=1 Tax=Lecanosticta acicola TaxID=111012 RepID=A0AAI8Z6D1_9PEZI|nr:Hypothetical predicted protein [Lecanosticta acicola]
MNLILFITCIALLSSASRSDANLLPLRKLAWHIPSQPLRWLRDPPILYINGTVNDKGLIGLRAAVEDLVTGLQWEFARLDADSGSLEVLGEKAGAEGVDNIGEVQETATSDIHLFLREIAAAKGKVSVSLNIERIFDKFDQDVKAFSAAQERNLEIILDEERGRRDFASLYSWLNSFLGHDAALSNKIALFLNKTIQNLAFCEFYRMASYITHQQVVAISPGKTGTLERYNHALDQWLRDQMGYLAASGMEPEVARTFIESQSNTYGREQVETLQRDLRTAGIRGGRTAACQYASEHLLDRRTDRSGWEEELIFGPARELRGVEWRLYDDDDEQELGIRPDWGDILDTSDQGKGHGRRCERLVRKREGFVHNSAENEKEL